MLENDTPVLGDSARSRMRRILVLIMLMGLGMSIRLVGLDHGAPDQIYHPDVSKIASAASRVYHGDISKLTGPEGDFRFKAYPFGSAVLTGKVLRVWDRMSGEQQRLVFNDLDAPTRWYWAVRLRWTSVLTGMVTIALLLVLLRRQVTPFGWILAGLLLILDPFHAQYSHYGINDVPMTSFLVLTWICTYGMLTGPRFLPVWSLAAGACLGLAFGVKYQAILGGVMFLPAWWGMFRARTGGKLAGSILLAAVGTLAGAWFSCPLLHTPVAFWELFVPFMRWQSEIIHRDAAWPVKVGYNLLTVLRIIARPGYLLLAVMALWGWWGGTRRRVAVPLRSWMDSGLLFCAVLMVVLISMRAFPRSNDLLPLFPFLVVLLALHLPRAEEWGKTEPRSRWCAAAALLLAVLFGVSSLRDSFALTRKDTRDRALAWGLAHVQPGQKIYREYYTRMLEIDGVNEQLAGTAARGKQKARILQNQFDYLVLSDLAHGRFFDPLSPYFNAKNRDYYRYLFEHYPVLAEFTDRRLFFAHPRIVVLGPRRQEDSRTADPGP